MNVKDGAYFCEGGVKGIFVTRDRPFFPVKCEMAYFFLMKGDFHNGREA